MIDALRPSRFFVYSGQICLLLFLTIPERVGSKGPHEIRYNFVILEWD